MPLRVKAKGPRMRSPCQTLAPKGAEFCLLEVPVQAGLHSHRVLAGSGQVEIVLAFDLEADVLRNAELDAGTERNIRTSRVTGTDTGEGVEDRRVADDAASLDGALDRGSGRPADGAFDFAAEDEAVHGGVDAQVSAQSESVRSRLALNECTDVSAVPVEGIVHDRRRGRLVDDEISSKSRRRKHNRGRGGEQGKLERTHGYSPLFVYVVTRLGAASHESPYLTPMPPWRHRPRPVLVIRVPHSPHLTGRFK